MAVEAGGVVPYGIWLTMTLRKVGGMPGSPLTSAGRLDKPPLGVRVKVATPVESGSVAPVKTTVPVQVILPSGLGVMGMKAPLR